jgi:hypothetical protein
MAALDLGAISAVINALAALAVLYIMQAVTADAGFGSMPALIKLMHRLTLAALSLALAFNAVQTILSETDPRGIDLAVQAMMFVAVLVSAFRHALPPLRPPYPL